ncbi:MAG TPA: hypothetical protein VHH73_13975, partial [Verrucomicrobiae bacterium]|nr:hypothetical protein [Verrucomicrobiae bacterium]
METSTPRQVRDAVERVPTAIFQKFYARKIAFNCIVPAKKLIQWLVAAFLASCVVAQAASIEVPQPVARWKMEL